MCQGSSRLWGAQQCPLPPMGQGTPSPAPNMELQPSAGSASCAELLEAGRELRVLRPQEGFFIFDFMAELQPGVAGEPLSTTALEQEQAVLRENSSALVLACLWYSGNLNFCVFCFNLALPFGQLQKFHHRNVFQGKKKPSACCLCNRLGNKAIAGRSECNKGLGKMYFCSAVSALFKSSG